MADSERGGFIGLLVKLVIGVAVLYIAYLLFRYAAGKGDWEFVSGPIKSLFKSV